ncbi:alpha/beta fold hydrolase [Meridianimarinicoccus sp. MJW13]|uniref:alpha/beta fold hydrolase n=1 Tax=Meridianimarinicoccus sp. MJW13 TaxID=2720031 RepID=UPI0018667804|nr:alpha/beta hydrolase [Fluviibacterium sp. MJW13]
MPQEFIHTNTMTAATGLPVVLLHGSAMTADTWKGLRGYIGARFDVCTLDVSRIRQLADLQAGTVPSLDELTEVAVAELARIGTPVHIVGHDFGAVLALKIASAYPGVAGSLSLIEPTAYNAVLPDCQAGWQTRQEVRATVAIMRASLIEGDGWRAMQNFIDLVHGPGTWDRTSRAHRTELALRAGETLADLMAISGDQMGPVSLAGVVCPTLQVTGGKTCWMNKQVAQQLRVAVPFLRDEIIADAGHLPHLSDPHRVDPLVYDFLVRANAQWQDTRINLRHAA